MDWPITNAAAKNHNIYIKSYYKIYKITKNIFYIIIYVIFRNRKAILSMQKTEDFLVEFQDRILYARDSCDFLLVAYVESKSHKEQKALSVDQ